MAAPLTIRDAAFLVLSAALLGTDSVSALEQKTLKGLSYLKSLLFPRRQQRANAPRTNTELWHLYCLRHRTTQRAMLFRLLWEGSLAKRFQPALLAAAAAAAVTPIMQQEEEEVPLSPAASAVGSTHSKGSSTRLPGSPASVLVVPTPDATAAKEARRRLLPASPSSASSAQTAESAADNLCSHPITEGEEEDELAVQQAVVVAAPPHKPAAVAVMRAALHAAAALVPIAAAAAATGRSHKKQPARQMPRQVPYATQKAQA